MSHMTHRRSSACAFILVAAASLSAAALACAQPAGPGSDPHRGPSRHDDPHHLDVVRPLIELRADTTGDSSLTSPCGLGRSGNEEVKPIPAGSAPDLQNIGLLADEASSRPSFHGASDGYDYILEWVQEKTSNDDTLAVNDDHVIDGAELELMGARTQALCALKDLVRKHKTALRHMELESLDHAR